MPLPALPELLRRLPRLGGFRIDETMNGEHVFEPGCGPPGHHPMSFTVTWGPDELNRWLDPTSDGFLRQRLSGRVTIEGLCEDAPCEGTLELRYFDEHALRYRFELDARGARYRFTGEKVNIQLWNLPVSHTTCYGVLTEAESGRLVSRSVLHFRLRTLPAFVRSLRRASA